MIARILYLLAVATALVAQPAPEQPAPKNDGAHESLLYVKAHYTKYEFRIPMRDGKRLFTSVYVPKDDSQPYPMLMTRTPYSVGPYGVDRYRSFLGPSEKFEKEGFIFVYQDVRGRYMSEGEFVEMRPEKDTTDGPSDVDESTDTYDTIDWLVKHIPNNNGRVGLVGISYPGFYAAAGIVNAHAALKAASPQAPIADLYMGDDAYHNGAFYLAANFGFYTSFVRRKGEPSSTEPPALFDFNAPDGYEFYLRMVPLSNAEHYLKHENPYWTELVSHITYDNFWKSRSLLPHLKNIRPAVLTVGGWFDAEDLSGPQKVFAAIEANHPPPVNSIVIGPWFHGGWARSEGDHLGDVSFNSKTSIYFRDNIQFPFFLFHLKGKGEPKIPKAWMFETGTNQWRRFDAWPPKSTTPKALYLRAGGKLSFDPPDEPGSVYDEYVSDPAKPVPIMAKIALDMPREYMISDQRFAGRRTDVLVYQTEPLDRDVMIAGPVTPHLWVSTSGTDSDFIVKLIDVYPDDYPNPNPNPRGVTLGGYQQLLRGEPFRGKFRNSFEKPEPFKPNEPVQIEYAMPSVCHVFRSGHRIMVQIQSSWFPLIDRNPQKFVNIPEAKASDFQKATERVYRSREQSTSIGVLVDQQAGIGVDR
ncbi:MAG TPA: CocE/NonD family hydrolase [Bryobacteraceae bacterium]|nr:CocE/NonD family hydrolase [Bryobacteraceae bacterium]